MGSNYFVNKTIIVLSPQPWAGLLISKHHYAIALAANNKVFYVTAPGFGKGYKVERPFAQLNLYLIAYNLLLPAPIKFHLSSLYRFFVKRKMRQILRSLDLQADVCIDFGCYQQYEDMNWIKAGKKIFFPVDDSEFLEPDNRGADLVISVSRNVCHKFTQAGLKCDFINHGLAPAFENAAIRHSEKISEFQEGKKIRVGYSGNLFIPFMDIDIFKKLILQNPGIDFVLFGTDKYLFSEKKMIAWAEFLKSAPNVKLRGVLSVEELATAYDDIDAFVLIYKADYKNYHGENSHKMLEYLSTGKSVISTFLSIYEGTDLFEMSAKDKNEKLELIFSTTIKNLRSRNSPQLQKKRIQFALGNTYEKQIERIGNLIEN